MSSHVSCRILSDKTDQTRTLLIWLEGFGGLEREGCLERTLEVGPHGPLMVFMWTWKLLWLKFRICLTCTCLVSIVQFYFCHINRAGKSRRLRNSSLLRCSQTYSRKWRLFKKICWDVESICKICLSRLFFYTVYRDCLGLDWRPLWCVKCSQPRQAYVEYLRMVDILWHIRRYNSDMCALCAWSIPCREQVPCSFHKGYDMREHMACLSWCCADAAALSWGQLSRVNLRESRLYSGCTKGLYPLARDLAGHPRHQLFPVAHTIARHAECHLCTVSRLGRHIVTSQESKCWSCLTRLTCLTCHMWNC